jgi:hypothetical protein
VAKNKFKQMKMLLILLSSFIFQVSVEAKQNLRLYYSNVFKAEKCLVEKEYSKAANYYKKAFKHKNWAFNDDYYNAKYCYKKANRIDTAYLESKHVEALDWNATEIIRNIQGEDQRVRQNDTLYDRELRKDTIILSKIIKTMLDTDSLNFVRFKKLMETVNVFDERLINYDEISNFFNHWFLELPYLQDYFLPIALKAVYEGTLQPYHYVDMASIKAWRENPEGTISDYGMNYLTIYRRGTENCNTNCKFLVFSYNQENKEWIEKVNENRHKIYLNDVVEQTITDFLLWESRYNQFDENSVDYFYARPQFIYPVPEYYFKEVLEQELKKNPKLNYYITGEHDFNTK